MNKTALKIVLTAALYSLADFLDMRKPAILETVNPYPGSLSIEGWQGDDLLLESDRPLHKPGGHGPEPAGTGVFRLIVKSGKTRVLKE